MVRIRHRIAEAIGPEVRRIAADEGITMAVALDQLAKSIQMYKQRKKKKAKKDDMKWMEELELEEREFSDLDAEQQYLVDPRAGFSGEDWED
jgi:hypothetical protein